MHSNSFVFAALLLARFTELMKSVDFCQQNIDFLVVVVDSSSSSVAGGSDRCTGTTARPRSPVQCSSGGSQLEMPQLLSHTKSHQTVAGWRSMAVWLRPSPSAFVSCCHSGHATFTDWRTPLLTGTMFHQTICLSTNQQLNQLLHKIHTQTFILVSPRLLVSVVIIAIILSSASELYNVILSFLVQVPVSFSWHADTHVQYVYRKQSSSSLLLLMLRDCADCAREDSGNYTCEVRGKRSSILASVTHHLYIRGKKRAVQLNASAVYSSTTTYIKDTLCVFFISRKSIEILII